MKKLNKSSGIGSLIFAVSVYLFFIIGWILNIVDLVRIDNLDFTAVIVIKFIGIVLFPLGAIMGWFF